MTQLNTNRKQRGFFDLGISLIVLAIGGTTAVVATPGETESLAAQQQTITSEAMPQKLLIGYDIDS